MIRQALTLGVVCAVLCLGACKVQQEPEADRTAASRPASRPSPVVTGVELVGALEAGFADSPAPKFAKPIRFTSFGPDAVLVADINNHAIRKVDVNGTVSTMTGGPDKKGHADGTPDKAQFDGPHGVALNDDGTVYVAEAGGHCLRAIDPVPGPNYSTLWVATTLAGAAGESGFVDGPQTKVRFNSPHGILWTSERGVVVCDIGNSRVRQVRGGQVKTIAGGPGADPAMKFPMDITLAKDGNLFVADAGNHAIYRIAPDNKVQKLDLERALETPHGVCVTPEGDLLVAEMKGHRIVRIPATGGKVTTVFGDGTAGSEPGRLNQPAAVLVHAGRLWIADLGNNQVKIVDWPLK